MIESIKTLWNKYSTTCESSGTICKYWNDWNAKKGGWWL